MWTENTILVRRSGLVLINKKKRICQLEDFTIQADYKEKIKENRKV